MFAKLAVVVVGMTCIAAGLMSLRQEKMEISHDIAQAHRQINEHRQSLWRLQGQVAQRVEPQSLRQAMVQSKLDLEPITPVATVQTESVRSPRGPRIVDRSTSQRSVGE